VLYALVAAGFLAVVALLVIGAGVVALVPRWWTAMMAVLVAAASVRTALHWRRTGQILALAIGLFVLWLVGTLIVSR
jgi:hypothetical protein